MGSLGLVLPSQLHVQIIRYYFSNLFYLGITLTASAIRRKPNAFNLVHQMEVLMRSGLSKEQTASNLQVCLAMLFCTTRCCPSNKLFARRWNPIQTWQRATTWAGTKPRQHVTCSRRLTGRSARGWKSA